MCGIAGFQGSKPAGLIDDMSSAIAHRGPDNLGTYVSAEHGVALGHARLSIIDLSPASNQPLWDATNRYCIVFNGEIYNYKELRVDLVSKGYQFNSEGDAEVLLNLFIEYGEEALNKLNGIFAFALWSEAAQELFIARDQLGVKPLYYAEPESGFVFSSEMKSLLQDTSVSRQLDRGAISHYLRYLWCPAPMTPLLAVRKLEPGYFLRVRNGLVAEQRSYFSLPGAAGSGQSLERSEQLLLEALKHSVERQLVADVKVGAFLSGGLDSSAVVALAANIVGAENLPCFTIDFDGGSAEGMQEDLPYAKYVADYLGVPLNIVKVDSSIVDDLPQLVYQLDEPQADVAPLNAWYIARLAREQGVKVLLSGAGGDDLLTGYRRHYALSKERYWAWLPRGFRFGLHKLTALLPKGNPLFRRIAKAFENAALSQDGRLSGYFHWLKRGDVDALFREPLGKVSDPLENYLAELPASASPLQKMLALDTRFFLSDHNFNYTDKVSMAEGVEVRVPLVDMEMVAVAAGIPDDQKQHGKHGKWIFKRVMERYLPNDVIYRPKTGFGAPVRPWIRNELRGMVDEILSDASLERRGIFNVDRVRDLVENDRAGKVDAAYTILSLMCFELWCRQFIDPDTPTPMVHEGGWG